MVVLTWKICPSAKSTQAVPSRSTAMEKVEPNVSPGQSRMAICVSAAMSGWKR